MSDRKRPLGERTRPTYVCVSLPADLYDQLFAVARQQRLTVPAIIRTIVRTYFPPHNTSLPSSPRSR